MNIPNWQDDADVRRLRRKVEELTKKIQPMQAALKTAKAEHAAALAALNAVEDSGNVIEIVQARNFEQAKEQVVSKLRTGLDGPSQELAAAQVELDGAEKQAQEAVKSELLKVYLAALDKQDTAVKAAISAKAEVHNIWTSLVEQWPGQDRPGGFANCEYRSMLSEEGYAAHKQWRDDSRMVDPGRAKMLDREAEGKRRKDEETREKARQAREEKERKAAAARKGESFRYAGTPVGITMVGRADGQ